MYISFALILIIISNVTRNKEIKALFLVTFIYLSFLLILRYGQGTDYFTYAMIYRTFPKKINEYKFFLGNVELGYGLISILFRRFNASSAIFLCSFSTITCLLLFLLLYQHSDNPLQSLTVFFLNYYLTYMQSAIRQTIAMIIFLLVLLRYFKNKKKIEFICFMIFDGLFFHLSALAYVILPFILDSKYFSPKKLFNPLSFTMYTIISLALSYLFFHFVLKLIPLIIPKFSFYLVKKENYSLPSIITRLCFSYIFIYVYNINKCKTDKLTDLYLQVYIIGVLFYLLVSPLPIFSRLSDYMSFIEILLVPRLIKKKMNIQANKRIVQTSFLILYLLLFIKDMKSVIQQGNYYSQSVMDYEYISLFNKDKIKEIRYLPAYYDIILKE